MNEPKKHHVFITQNHGQYNLMSTDKDYCVCLRLPPGAPASNISQTFSEEQDIDGLPPSEVIEILSKRLESYLYSSGRDKDRLTVQWARDHAAELDAQWAEREIAMLERHIDSLRAKIRSLHSYLPEPADSVPA